MKVSELTLDVVLNHIREVKENLEQTDIDLLTAETVAAIQYCISYTNLSQEELDNYPDITIAILCLIADMWDERNMLISSSVKENQTVNTILGMYNFNLLPTPENSAPKDNPSAVLPANFEVSS